MNLLLISCFFCDSSMVFGTAETWVLMTNAPICVLRVKRRLLRTKTPVYGIWGAWQGFDGSQRNLRHGGIQYLENWANNYSVIVTLIPEEPGKIRMVFEKGLARIIHDGSSRNR